jgi:hypothetical protein
MGDCVWSLIGRSANSITNHDRMLAQARESLIEPWPETLGKRHTRFTSSRFDFMGVVDYCFPLVTV